MKKLSKHQFKKISLAQYKIFCKNLRNNFSIINYNFSLLKKVNHPPLFSHIACGENLFAYKNVSSFLIHIMQVTTVDSLCNIVCI